jgi:hypothetical protein
VGSTAAEAAEGTAWRAGLSDRELAVQRWLASLSSLAEVDYPNVYVRTAEYRQPVLRFTVLNGKPGFTGTTTLRCTHIPAGFSLTRDGEVYRHYTQRDSSVLIATDVDREHVFELTLPP